MGYAEPTPGTTNNWCILAQQLNVGASTVAVLSLDRMPVLSAGDWYYGVIIDRTGTTRARVKVTEAVGTVLTITWIDTEKACFPVGSALHYDGVSTAAIQAKAGTARLSPVSPLKLDTTTGALSLDLRAVARQLPEVVVNADTPLQFDSTAGVFRLDVPALLALPEVKATILSWISSGDNYIQINDGVITLDIDAVKAAVTAT